MPVRVTVVGSGSSLETDTLGGRGVGEGTEGLSGRRLAGQSRQQSGAVRSSEATIESISESTIRPMSKPFP